MTVAVAHYTAEARESVAAAGGAAAGARPQRAGPRTSDRHWAVSQRNPAPGREQRDTGRTAHQREAVSQGDPSRVAHQRDSRQREG